MKKYPEFSRNIFQVKCICVVANNISYTIISCGEFWAIWVSKKLGCYTSNLKIEINNYGCYRTNSTQVICGAVITNLSNTRQDVSFSAYYGYANNWITNAIDTSGTVYGAQLAQSGRLESSNKGSSRFSINIASGIPTKIIFTFEIPKEVTQLRALDVGYIPGASENKEKRIAITNIGTIATKP